MTESERKTIYFQEQNRNQRVQVSICEQGVHLPLCSILISGSLKDEICCSKMMVNILLDYKWVKQYCERGSFRFFISWFTSIALMESLLDSHYYIQWNLCRLRGPWISACVFPDSELIGYHKCVLFQINVCTVFTTYAWLDTF